MGEIQTGTITYLQSYRQAENGIEMEKNSEGGGENKRKTIKTYVKWSRDRRVLKYINKPREKMAKRGSWEGNVKAL